MKRRLTYALAAAAVALGIASGLTGGYPALAGQVPIPPDTEPPGITTAAVDYFLKIDGPDGEAISDRNEDGYVDSATEPLAEGEVETDGWDLKATKGV
jgi:hypothetical protein